MTEAGQAALAPAPIIVTALLGPADFAWADAMRRAHFPADRNVLRAHLTLFHHLPPTVERELRDLLKAEARAPAPPARLASLVSLGGGVAYTIDSPELRDIRARIADRFAPLLMPQDRNAWRAHVTVQNKVKPDVARTLLAELQLDFAPRPIAIAGLAAWWYRGGPWENIGAWAFGTGHAMKPPA